jgi:outer membrane lipoprotein
MTWNARQSRLEAVRRALTVICLTWLAGCASSLPKEIHEAPPGNPNLDDVLTDRSRFIGNRVRWGGTIATVENHTKETWLEIVARTLQSDGRPSDSDTSPGRFMAVIDGFLDPMVYAAGRSVTVVGTITEPVTRKIGAYDYTFVVVRAKYYLLWQPLPAPRSYPYPPPWYDDPWYPYFPHHPWRYPPYWW